MSAAQQERNFSNCVSGWRDCDRCKLSQLQARKVADAEHQRNFSESKNGLETCDYSKVAPPEGEILATEH